MKSVIVSIILGVLMIYLFKWYPPAGFSSGFNTVMVYITAAYTVLCITYLVWLIYRYKKGMEK